MSDTQIQNNNPSDKSLAAKRMACFIIESILALGVIVFTGYCMHEMKLYDWASMKTKDFIAPVIPTALMVLGFYIYRKNNHDLLGDYESDTKEKLLILGKLAAATVAAFVLAPIAITPSIVWTLVAIPTLILTLLMINIKRMNVDSMVAVTGTTVGLTLFVITPAFTLWMTKGYPYIANLLPG